MFDEWQSVEGSTIVSAAYFDSAAHQISVRTHGGLVRRFDSCTVADWERFMSAPSKGEFYTNVLSRKPEVVSSSPPRPRRTQAVSRALVLNAFCPAQEMYAPGRFAGRRAQVLELADALRLEGSIPMIYGERGLGKSSLAIQAQRIARGEDELLVQLGAADYGFSPDEGFLTVYVSCSDEVTNCSLLLQALINAAEDVVPDSLDGPTHLVDRSRRTKIGLKVVEAETVKTFVHAKERASYADLGMTEKLQRLSQILTEAYSGPVLYVIDELDRVRDKDGLGSVLKRLSTNYMKFMLVGIAQDWSDLIQDHSSVDRIVSPIYVPRMSRPELAQIIDLAATYLSQSGCEIAFAAAARTRIVDLAGGFPWFAHVIGQAALMQTYDEGSVLVTSDAVVKALRDMVTNKFAQKFASRYRLAVRESRGREMVLRVIADHDAPEMAVSEIVRSLRLLDVPDTEGLVDQLCADGYGSVLVRTPDANGESVRFQDEMFRHFVHLAQPVNEGG